MKKNFLLGLMMAMILGCFWAAGFAFAEEAGPTNYVLIFQSKEYDSKLSDVVDYFFQQVLKPEDNLVLFTPQAHYNYSQQTRQTTPSEELIKRTKDVLKKDIAVGATTYNNIIDQMEMTIRDISQSTGSSSGGGRTGTSGSAGAGASLSANDLKNWATQYRQLVENLRSSRSLKQNLFLDLAAMFKEQKANNYIFLFYQKEMRLIPNRETLEALRNNTEARFEVNELFESDSTKEFMDADLVSQALKEVAAKLHFIYLETKAKRKMGTELKDNSQDVYNTLSKIAHETGGKVETTSKPEAAMKKILEEKK